MGIRTFVCVKWSVDPRVPVEVVSGEQAPRRLSLEPGHVVNVADRGALEVARRLAADSDGEVCAVTVGPAHHATALCVALWAGASRAIHVVTDGAPKAPWDVGALLAAVLELEQFDLVLCGAKGTDRGTGQVGPFLAELLDLPQVMRVVGLASGVQRERLVAQRLLERGERELLDVPLPALVCVLPAICNPPYVPARRSLRSNDERISRIPSSDLAPMPGSVQAVLEPQLVRLSQPRIRPKRILAPDSGLSAMERARMLAGGQSVRSGASVRGNPGKLAEQIIEFLTRNDLLRRSAR